MTATPTTIPATTAETPVWPPPQRRSAEYAKLLRSYGYDDLADLHDEAFEEFTYVRELQRALSRALETLQYAKRQHHPLTITTVAGEQQICADDGKNWPCDTYAAVRDHTT